MRSCLVAYVNHFYERRVRHICKTEKLEIRAVIKYFYKECLPRKFMKTSKEIHEDFMENLWKESPYYSTVKNGQQSLRGGERALRMMDGLATPKMPPLMK